MSVIIIVVVLLLICFFALYNGLVKKRNKCDEAFSTMDVYLKKRFDLIPNLVETVKGYAKHEAETLEAIIAKRNSGQMSTDQRMENENEITGAVRQIFALAESYPDLKANENFVNLQNQLQKVEEDIANSRKFYNAVVREYNDACQTVPSNIVASIGGFTRKPMYEASDADRENVQVSF
ncbi:MAG: LemA family protein [Erysipelotrichaceae bacterium]|nr:LemA family protein [Erysipelotrichaceae bacterium]